ncbi:MAG: hypothetical protein H6677_14425 [Candidatus Obscuribacterales bacterium]|nr:hypothetical protein [Candidatus Obscuribacterales bacterium]
MKSKTLAFLAAGLALSAFTWISPAPAEAQVCNQNTNLNSYNPNFNRRDFHRNRKAVKKHLKRAYRNNVSAYANANNSLPVSVPVNVNPYYVPANQNLYGNLVNPYYTSNNGLVRNVLNWF